MRQRLPRRLTRTTPGQTGIGPLGGIELTGLNKTGPPQAGRTETGLQTVGGSNPRRGPRQLKDLKAATTAVLGPQRQPLEGLPEVKIGDAQPNKQPRLQHQKRPNNRPKAKDKPSSG